MSDDDRVRWNARYNAGAYGERTNACALLERWVSKWRPILSGARALDLACGAGRNAIFLAEQGYSVDALDISGAALARGEQRATGKGVSINWQEQDLDAPQLEGQYELIIVIRYADLELVRRLPRLLAVGGRLLVEAHLGGPLFANNKDRRDPGGERLVGGPGSERFRLAPGSLARACLDAEAFAPLTVLHSDEALVSDPDGRLMALAQFVGERAS